MLLIITTAALATDTHTWPVDTDHLTVEVGAGQLHVEGGAERPTVTLQDVGEGCEVEVDPQGVRIRKRKGALKCEARVVARLPDHTAAEIAVGAGELHVVSTPAALVASVGAGTVELEDVGELELQVGTGEVSGDDLTAPARVRIGTGQAQLTWRVIPTGRIEVVTGLGEVEVDLPDGARVRLDGTPQQRVDLTVDPESETVVAVRTGLGSVSVR